MLSTRSPIVIIQHVIGAVLGLLGLLFILRVGNFSAGWGFVSFGIGYTGILSLFSDLGYSTAHTIKLSNGEDVGACNATYLRIKLILGAVFVLLVIGSLLFWVHVLHRGFDNPIEFWIVVALIPYYFFKSLIGFPNAYYRAKIKSGRMAIPGIIESSFRNSVFIFLALAIRYGVAGAGGYAPALYISMTYSISYALYFSILMILGRPWTIGKPSRELAKSYTMLAIPLMFVSSVAVINGNIDKVIINFFWENIATGAFYTSQMIANVVITLSTSLTMFFLPLLSISRRSKKIEEYKNSIFEYERLTSLFVLPIVVYFALLSGYILNLFTQTYFSYFLMLSLLSIVAYISAINTPYRSVLESRQKTGIIARIDISVIIVNIILILILVPPNIFGITRISQGASGAAIAILSSSILSAALYRLNVFKIEHISFNWRILKHIGPVISEVAVILFIEHFISPRSVFVLLGTAALSVVVYFSVAVLIKETTISDISKIITEFSPRSLKKRYREEK